MKTQPLTNKQKQKRFRDHKISLGQKELRGIWVTPAEAPLVKALIEDFLKNKRYDL